MPSGTFQIGSDMKQKQAGALKHQSDIDLGPPSLSKRYIGGRQNGLGNEKPMGQSTGVERLLTLGIGIAMIAGFMWFLHWMMHLKEIFPPSPLV
jgi:hypothetical protein